MLCFFFFCCFVLFFAGGQVSYFWFVDIPLVCIVKVELIAQFSVDHLPHQIKHDLLFFLTKSDASFMILIYCMVDCVISLSLSIYLCIYLSICLSTQPTDDIILSFIILGFLVIITLFCFLIDSDSVFFFFRFILYNLVQIILCAMFLIYLQKCQCSYFSLPFCFLFSCLSLCYFYGWCKWQLEFVSLCPCLYNLWVPK